MTTQFAQPTPGRTIRVTTRFPDHYYWAKSPWQDTTYEQAYYRKFTVPDVFPGCSR